MQKKTNGPERPISKDSTLLPLVEIKFEAKNRLQ